MHDTEAFIHQVLDAYGVLSQLQFCYPYYNRRVHWAFQNDEVETPLEKLGSTVGRPLPEDFELRFLATGKRFTRNVDGQGRISWKRYRLYIRAELKKERVEIREFFDSLVVIYQSGTVVSYACTHEHSTVASVPNTPVLHDHPGIEPTTQLELFDLSQFPLRYVSRRPPNQKYPPGNATQLVIEGLQFRVGIFSHRDWWVKEPVTRLPPC